MPNGAAVTLPAELDAPVSAEISPDGQHSIELQIGEAAALAVSAMARAMLDHQQNGMLTPTTKERGGCQIAQVVQLHLDTLGK
jgi:hypothetical protein